MKHIFTWVLFLVALFPCVTNAQTMFEFTYNESGHRELREVILLKSAKANQDTMISKQTEMPLACEIGLQELLIFPNPTNGIVRIEIPLLDSEAYIRVYDSNGKAIIQKTTYEPSSGINLSGEPSGIYILSIRIGSNKKEWKIIKE
ncbi:MAG TPA: T9SS type A sorting domain-containing protein [Candidatus Cloacimonadota bacterium]|jgi:hypothetical protein|nr:T9SS type A sorting domain-containing protein [Candidatus Cloacimonadota bacterium]